MNAAWGKGGTGRHGMPLKYSDTPVLVSTWREGGATFRHFEPEFFSFLPLDLFWPAFEKPHHVIAGYKEEKGEYQNEKDVDNDGHGFLADRLSANFLDGTEHDVAAVNDGDGQEVDDGEVGAQEANKVEERGEGNGYGFRYEADDSDGAADSLGGDSACHKPLERQNHVLYGRVGGGERSFPFDSVNDARDETQYGEAFLQSRAEEVVLGRFLRIGGG